LIDANGRRVHHNGGRLTGSLANPIYQKYVARIATEMAKRYGKDPRINRLADRQRTAHPGGSDYSPSAHQAFIAWLKNKYGTIEAVNESWGATVLELYVQQLR
jgi:beta-galactosidase